MLTFEQKSNLCNLGLPIDMFGQLIKVGDTVLCKGYGSCDKNHMATVKRVNRKSIVIDITRTYRNYGKYVPRPAGHVGRWDYYPDLTTTTEAKEMRRIPTDTMLITPEQKAAIDVSFDYLIDNHPEAFI